MTAGTFPEPSWFVGCGNMAGAMVEGWRSAGVDFGPVTAIRPSGRAVPGVRTVTALPQGGEAPRLVMLGFKPQMLDNVAPALASSIGPETLVVSLLAGVEAKMLEERFAAAGAVVRAMPNLPVSERRGVIALHSESGDAAMRERVGSLFGLLGFAPWTESEAEFAVIGAVAGSGPAYVARVIEALAKAGTAKGLDPGLAARIALLTASGTAAMAEASGETMAALARRVASPKGTTEAGLAVLDEDRALDRLIARVIDAAAARGAELAAEARARPPQD